MRLPFLYLLLLTACHPQPKPLERTFFAWETKLDLTAQQRGLMDSLSCKRLYVKVLDVGKNATNGAIEPYSITEWPADTSLLSGLTICPAVFLTNEVFQNLPPEKTEWLAEKVSAHCKARISGAASPEVLLDCDWTASTRQPFFEFLAKMREKLPPQVRLSATIRLHQYKFPDNTGVPPVERGMLMFYNTGDVDEESGKNNIFHPEDARKYVLGAPKRYPLPMDLAMPLFSWAAVYREGELWKIVPGPLPLDEMRRSGKYFEHPVPDDFAAQLWEPKEGTFLGGHYLRPGDRLRVSGTPPGLLFKAAELARSLALADDATVAFFHLGTARQGQYPATLLDSVCKAIRPSPGSSSSPSGR
jgi:hypothetical protein